MTSYTHFTKDERNEIQAMLAKGRGVREIARVLGRGKTSVGDEISRNSVNGEYIAAKAQAKARVRQTSSRYQGKKIIGNPRLQDFVEKSLLAGQSPEAIAGRLKKGLEPGLPYVSRDTIETYIHSIYGRQLEYKLAQMKKEQGRRSKKRPRTDKLSDRKFVDEWPGVIVNRERVGDLEVDFIVSGKGGSGYILTAADRKIRNGFIRRVRPVTVAEAMRVLVGLKADFPEMTSVTLDNDILWRFHEQLEEALGVPVYFCHPYSSWEKGSVENFNKQARKYIKKGSDLSQYSDEYLAMVEDKLNGRFMKVLDYKTPKECQDEYRSQTKNTPQI
jgi:transposase, IS30 family